jgi:hypothetical protein
MVVKVASGGMGTVRLTLAGICSTAVASAITIAIAVAIAAAAGVPVAIAILGKRHSRSA